MKEKNHDQNMSHVILFNSNVQLEEIINYSIGKLKSSEIIFLTPHCLFTNEENQILNALPKHKITFYHFGSFNNDHALYELDREAFLKSKNYLNYHSLYLNEFKSKLIYVKNQFLKAELEKKHSVLTYSVFCNKYDPYNLGISYAFWKKHGDIVTKESFGKSFTKSIKTSFNTGKLGQISYIIKAFVNSLVPRFFHIISDNGDFWFFRSLYRIKNKNVNITSKWIIPIFLQKKNSKSKVAIGLHESGKILNLHPFLNKRKVYIIGDAYRPSNYPPFLFAYLFKDTQYIFKYDIDKHFFRSNGIFVVDSRPSFLADETLFTGNLKNDSTVVKTVLLSINHAGDWTALINRSDTDVLIKSFVNIAKTLSQLNFIIRLHPTMDANTAEGINSKIRIKSFVESLNLENLSVSNSSMEEDWERGDLFISEYSLSVIDALNRGKLGIFYNLTNRRSFVDDLLNRGIIYFEKERDLIEELQKLTATDI